MANVGEEQITILTRERLDAIERFILVRNSFRDNFQARKQQRVEFAADTEQLFKPVTTATKKVAKQAKQVKESLRTLPAYIVAAQPAPAAAQPALVAVQPAPVAAQPEQVAASSRAEKSISPKEIFAADTLSEIKTKDNINDLARYAVDTWNLFYKYVNADYDKRILWKQWYKKCTV